jgi:hypothetical protein
MIIYQNTLGQDCVAFIDENGFEHSMLKSTYDAMQAEQSTPMVTDEAPTL